MRRYVALPLCNDFYAISQANLVATESEPCHCHTVACEVSLVRSTLSCPPKGLPHLLVLVRQSLEDEQGGGR